MPDRVLALIPARGGSKRIPRKNVAPCGGKPLIAWTIEAARASGVCSRVVVSTDDEEIAAVSREHGAEVPFMRPAEFATDTATSMSVESHAIRWLAHNHVWRAAWCILLQPTSPLRSADDISGAMACAREHKTVLLSSVTDGPRVWPVERDRWAREAPETPLHVPYVLNGAIYIRRWTPFGDWSADVRWGYYMPPDRSLDVDTPWDLAVADAVLKERACST